MNSYEFSGSQNELIQDLSKKMVFVSYFLIVAGVLNIIIGALAIFRGGGSEGLSAGLSTIIQGVVTIVIGKWTLNAGSAFKAIVNTQGTDVENLMGALGELRKLYTLQFWVLIIALVFIVLGVILAIVGGIAAGV